MAPSAHAGGAGLPSGRAPMPGQTPRRDSEDARQRILEAACRIFAERGVDRATGKEITEAAGVNVAEINHHFGGAAALYGEVLVMAHRRVVAQDALSDIAEGDGDPVARLRQLIDSEMRRKECYDRSVEPLLK